MIPSSQETTLIVSQIKSLYQQIYQIALEQINLLKSGRLFEELSAELEELSQRRQKCMDTIDALSESFPRENYQEADQQQIVTIIRAILKYDNECQALLKQIIEQTNDKLVNVQEMKKANRAYGGQDEPAEAWFFDRKR